MSTAEETTAKALERRYEGLTMVRNKAIRGKGAWYWAHLEPLLVQNPETGLPKAVKLKCCLCDTVFSASNPSRTASEHLKRGTCPNFHRQTSTSDMGGGALVVHDPVKRLKTPKTSPVCALSKCQIDCALEFLGDWVYESCGSVSISSLEHPKFKAFLNQVGIPEVSSKREFCGSRLDARYEEARSEAEVRIRCATFFQIASDGWKLKGGFEDYNLVNMSVNLPNGTSVYRKAVFTGGRVNCEYAEEVLWETIEETCGNGVVQCVGIVADKFKNTALRNLESQNQWMVNLSCLYQSFNSLIKDFYRDLPLFKNVAEKCLKVGNFVNNNTQVRNSFLKYQLREHGSVAGGLLRVPVKEREILNFEPVYALIEDIMSSARVLQLVLLDEYYKIASSEDPVVAREFEEIIRDVGFWNDLEAVRSLVRLVKEMAHELEIERPLVGQCLPLWEELRNKVKDWCAKFHIDENLVETVVERRFKKNYHPAWAAAYVLDPIYLIRDSSGKYLPPFKCLTPEQDKDVDKLITRLVSREEAHIALMELMKWRAQGLDPVYAQAVQLKQRDPSSGKMKIANPQASRLVWETYLPDFNSLGKVAVRLILLHATARGFKCHSSFLKWVQPHARSRLGIDRAQKLIFLAAHSKLHRRDFASEEDKDMELFASTSVVH